MTITEDKMLVKCDFDHNVPSPHGSNANGGLKISFHRMLLGAVEFQ